MIEEGWCREESRGEGWGFPWGEELSVPGRLQTHRSPVISRHPGSLLTAPLTLLHTHTHIQEYTLATIRALALCDLSTHTTTHSNSIDIRTLVLILPLRTCICTMFTPTSIFNINLERSQSSPPSRTPRTPKLLLLHHLGDVTVKPFTFGCPKQLRWGKGHSDKSCLSKCSS